MPEEVLELLELDEEDEEDELLELDELELEELLLVVEELLEDELLDDELLPGSPDPLPHADTKRSKVKMVRRFAALFFILCHRFVFVLWTPSQCLRWQKTAYLKANFRI